MLTTLALGLTGLVLWIVTLPFRPKHRTPPVRLGKSVLVRWR